MSFKEALDAERREFYVRAGGGAALPLAGLIYWAVLAWAGTALSASSWTLVAFVGSGMIFPLGLLLAKPTGSDPMAKSAFSGATFAGLLAVMMCWPLIMASSGAEPTLAPLALAIAMSVHWPVIGWSYGRLGLFTAHSVIRVGGCTAVWMLYPDQRFVNVPLVVVGAYAVSLIGILATRGRRSGAYA